MKNKLILLIAIGVCIGPFLAEAQSAYKNKAQKMSVTGSSTLHEWESDVSSVTCKGMFTVAGNQLSEIKNVQVTIPVTSIKSTKGKTMDNKTYEAFDSEKNPNIQYRLTSAKLSGAGPEYTVIASGNLTMAGTTKPVELNTKAKVLGNGDVQITGAHKINMKDFNMVPPTAMMGTIKVGEEVTVNFDLTLTPDK
jgi:polyisoprenoid-binding protein YceI